MNKLHVLAAVSLAISVVVSMQQINLKRSSAVRSTETNEPHTQPTPPGTKVLLESSTVDKLRETAERLKPLERGLREDIRQGEWSAAEEKLSVLEADWQKEGQLPLHLKRLAAEILVGQGKPQEALLKLGAEDPRLKRESESVRLLAYAQLGRVTPSEANAYLGRVSKKYSLNLHDADRTVSSRDPIAAIRLARAIDAWFEANIDGCHREAKEALQFASEDPVASYLLAKCLQLKGEEIEARRYWGAASKLSGPWGEEARAILGVFPDLSSIEIE